MSIKIVSGERWLGLHGHFQIHTYILFCSNKTISIAEHTWGELDGKVHRTLTTIHENMKK